MMAHCMKKLSVVFVSLLVFLNLVCIAPGISPALAATIDLWDWAFNIDGVTSEYSKGHSMPVTGTLDADGLGTLTWQTSMTGGHSFIAFFDYEIDESTNTLFNEYGNAINSPDAGQSWEIDEPGYVFGDIYQNVLSGSLDNSNGVPATAPDDVSWALGWDFTLNAGQKVTIDLALASTIPSSGFYLAHTDPDSHETISFSSKLNVEPGQEPNWVQLEQLEAVSQGYQILITWRTLSEPDTAGFNLWRSESAGGQYVKINTWIIEATGGATLGAEYSYTDNTAKDYVAKPRSRYYYELEDINTRGESTFHGPVSIVL